MLIFNIVNQAYFTAINGNASNRIIRIAPLLDRLHGVSVNDFVIFDFHVRILVDCIDYEIVYLFYGHARSLFHTLFQCLCNQRRFLAQLRRQPGVAAAQCQSVSFPANRAIHYLHRQLQLLDHFTDDKIGIVVFAGDAFVQLPITNDYVSAKMFLQNLDPSLIATQGTDIARAINLSASSFTQQQKVGRAIILITDGEDHEGGAEEAAKAAAKKGINVFILGVGDPKGAPIPVGGGEYLKDNNGQVVMSALNEEMCRSVAKAGSGTYIHVDNSNDAQEKLNSELSKLQKGETGGATYSNYAEQFQIFALLALLFLVLDACILEVKNPRWRNVRLFRKRRI